MFIDNCVQLRGNLREVTIQIKRFHADLIATHPIAVIRLYCFVSCGIQKHTGHPMRFISKLGVFVFHIFYPEMQYKCSGKIARKKHPERCFLMIYLLKHAEIISEFCVFFGKAQLDTFTEPYNRCI